MWLLEHDLQRRTRPTQGEVVWKRPSYGAVHRLLTNPVYGSAYAIITSDRIFGIHRRPCMTTPATCFCLCVECEPIFFN